MNKRLIFEVGLVAAIGIGVFLYERKKKADAAEAANEGDINANTDESTYTSDDLSNYDSNIAGVPGYLGYNVSATPTPAPSSSTSTANNGVPVVTPLPPVTYNQEITPYDAGGYKAVEHASPLIVAATKGQNIAPTNTPAPSSTTTSTASQGH